MDDIKLNHSAKEVARFRLTESVVNTKAADRNRRNTKFKQWLLSDPFAER